MSYIPSYELPCVLSKLLRLENLSDRRHMLRGDFLCEAGHDALTRFRNNNKVKLQNIFLF